MLVNVRWLSFQYTLKNSCWNGDKCVGEVIFSIASSNRSLAACPYSGADSGIHPISGLYSELRCSLVVTIFSPVVFFTTIFRMFASSKEKYFTLTSPDHPSFVRNKVLPISKNSDTISLWDVAKVEYPGHHFKCSPCLLVQWSSFSSLASIWVKQHLYLGWFETLTNLHASARNIVDSTKPSLMEIYGRLDSGCWIVCDNLF